MLSTIVLFILLSPGFLITLPPGKHGLFFSGETSLTAILLHASVLALLLAFRRKIPYLRDALKTLDSVV